MQIKRHWFLVETMPFEYFFSGVNTLASSSKQSAQAKAKGLRSLLCAIIPPFRRVPLHPRLNGRPNRLKARFSATVRVNCPPFPPELSAVRITDRVSGTRARIPLPSGSTPCAASLSHMRQNVNSCYRVCAI